MSTVIIIALAIGIGVLLVYIIKTVVIPRRTAAAANLLNKSKILQTIRKAKSAIEKDPQNSEAHFILGKAFLADKRDEQAFREYRTAARLGIEGTNIPETEFRETIAGLYARFHEEEEALKEYVYLIKQHPEFAEYYFQAGKLFSGRNRGELAVQYMRKAISLNPKDERYHFELGMHYYHAKRVTEAGGEFEAVLKLNPVNGEALFYLGKMRKDSKNYADALPFLEKAARDPENKFRALVELGSCYMSLKMIDKAIIELERASNIITDEADPLSLYARYFLGMCYEKKQEFARAIVQYDRIYAQKKNFRDVAEKVSQYEGYRQESAEKGNS